jgi:hypothetical protein
MPVTMRRNMHLEDIRKIRVGNEPLEFILAVPARRYGDFDKLLSRFHESTCVEATKEVFQEFEWKDGSRASPRHGERPER